MEDWITQVIRWQSVQWLHSKKEQLIWKKDDHEPEQCRIQVCADIVTCSHCLYLELLTGEDLYA